MNFLHIDTTKCTQDGLCAMECPMNLISMTGGAPQPVPGAAEHCVNCGHCVTVCPHGALSLQTMPAEQCPPLQKSWRIPPKQMEQLLKGRRSVRVYQHKEVERKTLKQIVDFARFAPSAGNVQPIDWIVIQKPGRVRELAQLVIGWMRGEVEEQSILSKSFNFADPIAIWDTEDDRILRGAPHLLITHAPQARANSVIDAAIALTYAELAALSFDLGSCWAGHFYIACTHSPDLQRALALPESHKCTGALMLGYPKLQHQRIPLRSEARIAWN